jgi:putative pyruvate formate lyase activating enzyme
MTDACTICPRGCISPPGRCGCFGEKGEVTLAWAGLHFGEEPPITGRGGSGILFVTGCGLGCTFCQNWQISHKNMGRPVDQSEFLRICSALEAAGAENINIVTGSHVTPILARFLRAYKSAPRHLPVCWNSSAYERTETLELLRGLVDIWLPDLKTLSRGLAQSLFSAPDYPDVARDAISWMLQEGGGSAIIRHLFLPGHLDETIAVLDWLSRHARRATVSLMTQYTPIKAAKPAVDLPARYTTEDEYSALRDLLAAYSFPHLFYQELVADNSWLPDFTQPCPFPNNLAKTIWHWRQ